MQLKNREGTLRVNGVDIWYKVMGHGPVLAIQPPGWGVGSKLYEETLADLAERYTLVLHDTRGSGRSMAPTVDYSQVNVGTLNDDLEALRQHLQIERWVVFGHSHGGFVAANYALKYPGHLAGLVLVDAQVGVDEPGADLARTLPTLAVTPGFEAAVAAFTGLRSLKTDADLGAFLQKIGVLYFKDPASPAAAVLADYVARNRIALAAFGATSATDKNFLIRERLHAIGVPTLVLVGAHDFICSPVQARILADGIPGAQLVQLADSGHMGWIEEPQAFGAALHAFLDGLADA
jgi:proline iminopeptidase